MDLFSPAVIPFMVTLLDAVEGAEMMELNNFDSYLLLSAKVLTIEDGAVHCAHSCHQFISDRMIREHLQHRNYTLIRNAVTSRSDLNLLPSATMEAHIPV
jgi:hypothetical protein